MKTLDEIERRLRDLVEVRLAKLIPGYKPEKDVSHQLANAMFDGLVKRGNLIKAPNIFTISAHPSTLSSWNANPELLDSLASALYQAGNEAGFRFSSRLRVVTVADASLAPEDIRILAAIRTGPLADTRGIPAVGSEKEEPKEDTVPSNAFLILGGTKIIPLTSSVINIGRRLDNHIIIDDPRVSRAHAQLRTVKGRFVVFDLESTGGTYVNGKRTSQCILYPGDVLSLAGVSLIFGQDLPPTRTQEEVGTEPGSPYSGERPTVQIESDDKIQ